MTYALDTNTISYFVQDNVQIISRLRYVLAAGNNIKIPPVVYYEMLRGFRHKPSPKKEKAFAYMCSLYSIGGMNLATWETAAEIYAATRKAGMPVEDTDILIAAFCIVNDCTLVTNNVKHFKDIDGLKLENWIAQ